MMRFTAAILLFFGCELALADQVSLSEPPAKFQCTFGNPPQLGIVIDGGCFPSFGCTNCGISISAASLPRCEEGYELVMRSDMRPWCAKEVKPPL